MSGINKQPFYGTVTFHSTDLESLGQGTMDAMAEHAKEVIPPSELVHVEWDGWTNDGLPALLITLTRELTGEDAWALAGLLERQTGCVINDVDWESEAGDPADLA